MRPHVERGPLGEAEVEHEAHPLGVAGVADRLDVEAGDAALQRLGEAAQPGARVEGLHGAEAVHLHALDARHGLARLDLPVHEDGGGLGVVVQEALRGVGQPVAERLARFLRHVADADAHRSGLVHRADGPHGQHADESGRQPTAGHHPALPPLGVLGEGGVRQWVAEVDEVGAQVERQPRQPRRVLRPDARHDAGAPVQDRLQRLRVAGVGLVGAEAGVGVGGAEGAEGGGLGLAHLYVRGLAAAGEVDGDGGADSSGSEDGDLHAPR